MARHARQREGARVGGLLEGVEEDDEVAGSLVKKAVPDVREPDPQLAKATLDLRGDRKLRRWIVGATRRRLRCQEPLEPGIDWLAAVDVAVVHRLRPPSKTDSRVVPSARTLRVHPAVGPGCDPRRFGAPLCRLVGSPLRCFYR